MPDDRVIWELSATQGTEQTGTCPWASAWGPHPESSTLPPLSTDFSRASNAGTSLTWSRGLQGPTWAFHHRFLRTSMGLGRFLGGSGRVLTSIPHPTAAVSEILHSTRVWGRSGQGPGNRVLNEESSS